MERQIDRPIPRPSGLLVVNGSKIDSIGVAAMPVPLSSTSTTTRKGLPACVRTVRRRVAPGPISRMALNALSMRFRTTC